MNAATLIDIAQSLVAGDKGLLAMDESTPTCNKRFARLGIPETEQARRDWRELIVTTPELGEYVSGVILYDETNRQHAADGTALIRIISDAGIMFGIKVDTGPTIMAGFPDERVTEGLDGLRERLTEYAQVGARFAKWRAMIAIGANTPSRACIDANAHALARYAALCQEVGLVPIVEPEVLMHGDHSLQRSGDVTEAVLHSVFDHLYVQRVMLEGMILKPNMVLPGLDSPNQADVNDIVDATQACLIRCVPAAVPGIAFLSGGQGAEAASTRLNAINVQFGSCAPWALSFSLARAIQTPALHVWAGDNANKAAAQRIILRRVRCNQAARRGQYNAGMECG